MLFQVRPPCQELLSFVHRTVEVRLGLGMVNESIKRVAQLLQREHAGFEPTFRFKVRFVAALSFFKLVLELIAFKSKFRVAPKSFRCQFLVLALSISKGLGQRVYLLLKAVTPRRQFLIELEETLFRCLQFTL